MTHADTAEKTIIRRYAVEKQSIRRIADHTNRSPRQVRRVLTDNGIEIRQRERVVNDELMAQAVRLYESGLSSYMVARALRTKDGRRTTQTTVLSMLRRAGVKIRPRGPRGYNPTSREGE